MNKSTTSEVSSNSCPYCGSKNLEPYDFDSWFCMGCIRDYPTEAYTCKALQINFDAKEKRLKVEKFSEFLSAYIG